MIKAKFSKEDKVVFCYQGNHYIGKIQEIRESLILVKSKEKIFELRKNIIYKI